MEGKINNTSDNTFSIINKVFDIDWDLVKSIDDIKTLLRGLNFQVYLSQKEIPDHLKEIFESGFLKERK